MNPALEATYAFIETVVAEDGPAAPRGRRAAAPLARGGDEVPNGAWERSPAADAARRAAGAEHVRELWFPFYARARRSSPRRKSGSPAGKRSACGS